ncbi:DMP19 family protein [Larkinella sp. GY13]|uniref:DMP19 family protein n=1 Tax=Larkinella sp. GY13 TaxID=3453720 RepID=UPI003EEA305A
MGSNLVESAYQKAVLGIDQNLLIATYPVWYNYVMNLPVPQRLTYEIITFHNQVFNGGLHQYFFNSYGQFAFETINCLQVIKAFPQAEILSRAIERLRLEESNNNQLISKIANRELSCIVDFEDETFEYLNRLDTEYYACEKNLEQLLDSFSARNIL